MFLISWKKCWWWTVQIKHFPDHYHSLLSDVAFKCKHHSAFLALVSRTRIPLNSTWTFRNHCVWNIVDRKSKVISLYNLKMRSIFIYLAYEFSDRNEGMDVTFKNDIFSHLNAFCENKLTIRDVFSRNHAVIIVETDQESHHVRDGEHKYIVFILVLWLKNRFLITQSWLILSLSLIFEKNAWSLRFF